jgi:glycosyltransferase involved in cell wall biosynthesis
MVAIEALACGTPVIGLQSGALPEVIANGRTGYIVPKDTADDATTAASLAATFADIPNIDRQACRADFEARFTVDRMCGEYLEAYKSAR